MSIISVERLVLCVLPGCRNAAVSENSQGGLAILLPFFRSLQTKKRDYTLGMRPVVAGRLQQGPVGEHAVALPSPDVCLLLGVRKCITHSHTYGSKAGS